MQDQKETKKHDIENFQREESQLNVTFQLKSINSEEIKNGINQMEKYLKTVGVEYSIKEQNKKIGKITTRKGPSGQGTCTMAKYKIMVHSKDISFQASNKVVGQISSFIKGIGIEANVFMNN